MTHTPGPWRIMRGDSVVHVVAANDAICKTSTKNYWQKHDETDLANACLIAAAPEMLEALRMVMQHGLIDNSEARMNQVASAIAKAEGR